MPTLIQRLFRADFMPDVMCLREPGFISLHAAFDGLIAAADVDH